NDGADLGDRNFDLGVSEDRVLDSLEEEPPLTAVPLGEYSRVEGLPVTAWRLPHVLAGAEAPHLGAVATARRTPLPERLVRLPLAAQLQGADRQLPLDPAHLVAQVAVGIGVRVDLNLRPLALRLWLWMGLGGWRCLPRFARA